MNEHRTHPVVENNNTVKKNSRIELRCQPLLEVEASLGVRAGRAGPHNNSLARAEGSSVVWARRRRRRILERARAHRARSLRCLAPSQVQHQARTLARVPSVEVGIPELNQLAVASSAAAAATLPRARSKISRPAGAFSAAVAGRRHKINRRQPGAVGASSAIQRQTNLNRRLVEVEVAVGAGAFLAVAAAQQRTSRRRQVVVSLGAAAERLRRERRVNHNRRVVDCSGTPRRRPGRRVAQGPNLQRREAFLVLVPLPVRVRERLGRGRQVFSEDNNRNNRRRRVGYSETRGAALPHHSQAVYLGIGQRSSNLRLAVDCSAVLRGQLNSSSNLRQAVDFLGVPLLNSSPLRAVGYLGALQPNSNLLQAADCLGVPPNNSRPRAADYLEVLQLNNNNNNPLRVVDCLGFLLPNSSLLRAVGCLEARPHSSQPQAVVGASLLPLQHSRPNSLDQALFLVRQQRRAQVYLGAAAQEH